MMNREVVAAALTYAGFGALLMAAVELVRPISAVRLRRRKAAALLAASGAGMVATALNLPVATHRVRKASTELDRVLPEYQFREFHDITIAGAPDEIFRAIEQIRADEILFFRTLTWIRSPRLVRRAEDILSPGRDRPILEVATGTSFVTLARQPDRELVVGTVVRGRGAGQPCAPEQFETLTGPGVAKAAMNFVITPLDARRCRVSTETRVHATDARSRRVFARYWRVIYPGSSFIRRMWLRGIRNRVSGEP